MGNKTHVFQLNSLFNDVVTVSHPYILKPLSSCFLY